MKDNKIKFTNLVWVVCCLLVVIVFLVAFILFDRSTMDSEIAEYLSYASLILSILLSVFAILFSYYSSGQIDSKLGEMENAVSKIEKANDTLSTSYKSFIESLLMIQEKIGSIDAKQHYGGAQNNNLNSSVSFPNVTTSNQNKQTDVETQPNQ